MKKIITTVLFLSVLTINAQEKKAETVTLSKTEKASKIADLRKDIISYESRISEAKNKLEVAKLECDRAKEEFKAVKEKVSIAKDNYKTIKKEQEEKIDNAEASLKTLRE
ncbi:hypothetical protein ACXGQW_05675 [Wenyingzhuangia sp. IMCC45533]